MERVVLHADANAFYASVECFFHPEYKERPLAVCGDPAARHGIVLAKNQAAKRFNIKTGEAVWQARQKCPGLIVMPPHFDEYLKFSNALQKIYMDYTNRVEAMGLDECWLDVSNPHFTIQDGTEMADAIRERVMKEVGITVSVGVSFNKTFAKLGSDLKKPNGTTTIARQDVASKVWPLPASDMLCVGPSTMRTLRTLGILTIGDLAHSDPRVLQRKLGKCGLLLRELAAGRDITPVVETCAPEVVKSIGNSTTPPFDIENLSDARRVFYALAESVAARLRAGHFRASRVSISARTTELVTASHQCMLQRPTDLTTELMDAAMTLFVQRFSSGFPYRSLGISAGCLRDSMTPEQVSIFCDEDQRARQLRLEETIDTLRERYGKTAVVRGSLMTEQGTLVIDGEQTGEGKEHESALKDYKFKSITGIMLTTGASLPRGKGRK